jgi:hypothetical protein
MTADAIIPGVPAEPLEQVLQRRPSCLSAGSGWCLDDGARIPSSGSGGCRRRTAFAGPPGLGGGEGHHTESEEGDRRTRPDG